MPCQDWYYSDPYDWTAPSVSGGEGESRKESLHMEWLFCRVVVVVGGGGSGSPLNHAGRTNRKPLCGLPLRAKRQVGVLQRFHRFFLLKFNLRHISNLEGGGGGDAFQSAATATVLSRMWSITDDP